MISEKIDKERCRSLKGKKEQKLIFLIEEKGDE
jgi:hypothetical protein